MIAPSYYVYHRLRADHLHTNDFDANLLSINPNSFCERWLVMKPTFDQRLAMEAMLTDLIGPLDYRRLCSGMEVGVVGNVLNISVPSEDRAAEIETHYSDDFAVAAEAVLLAPIRAVNVRSRALIAASGA